MSLAAAAHRVIHAVSARRAEARPVRHPTVCSVSREPTTNQPDRSRRQLLGAGFAWAAVLTAVPAAMAASEEGAGNRAVRFSGGVKASEQRRAQREQALKDKIAALKAEAASANTTTAE